MAGAGPDNYRLLIARDRNAKTCHETRGESDGGGKGLSLRLSPVHHSPLLSPSVGLLRAFRELLGWVLRKTLRW